MPKKDTQSAVLGMLSTAGAQTRSTAEELTPGGSAPLASSPAAAERPGEALSAVRSLLPPSATERPAEILGPVRTLSSPNPTSDPADRAPRTMRLREATAASLRAAWLEAKRDDVLLTAQDFASELVEDALRRRRRTARS